MLDQEVVAAQCRVALLSLGKPLSADAIRYFSTCLAERCQGPFSLAWSEKAVATWAKEQPDVLEPQSLEAAVEAVINEDPLGDCMGHPERGKPGVRLVSVPARKIADLREALERHRKRARSKTSRLPLRAVEEAARSLVRKGWAGFENGGRLNDDPALIVNRDAFLDLRAAVQKLDGEDYP